MVRCHTMVNNKWWTGCANWLRACGLVDIPMIFHDFPNIWDILGWVCCLTGIFFGGVTGHNDGLIHWSWWGVKQAGCTYGQLVPCGGAQSNFANWLGWTNCVNKPGAMMVFWANKLGEMAYCFQPRWWKCWTELFSMIDPLLNIPDLDGSSTSYKTYLFHLYCYISRNFKQLDTDRHPTSVQYMYMFMRIRGGWLMVSGTTLTA